MKRTKVSKASEGFDETSEASFVESIPMDLLGKKDLYPVAKGDKIAKAANALRRNRSSTIRRTDEYANIKSGLSPFRTNDDYDASTVDINDAVKLCQQAYYNFSVFGNTIEMMVEFSVSDIRLKGKNEKANKFFETLFKKINLNSLQEQFYRERYRSGNTFIYRHEIIVDQEYIRKLNQVYGAEKTSGLRLPVKYEILNPVDIKFSGGVTYSSGGYYKELNDYEISYLKNRETQDAKDLYNSLSPENKKKIDSETPGAIIELTPDKVLFSFYRKQDYEPFAIPMGFPVLRDINWKEELKNMDMALSRVCQQVILLITHGEKKENGGIGINPATQKALAELFKSESIGRTLVSDYTTKAEFVIPQIADILDPVKYQVVNEDIRIGLHNVLFSNEKFANQSSKMNLFLEKLRFSRNSFLNDFLIPEIKRISEMMGFKTYPEPYFDEEDLKDEVEYARIYTRLYEIGVLTPEEVINAINTGILPDPDKSLESQDKLSKLRKKEQYLPITYFQKPKEPGTGGANGRPPGTKKKQSTKKIKPLGASELIEVIKKVDNFKDYFNKQLLENNKGKILNAKQNIEAEKILRSILINEEIQDFEISCSKYIKENLTEINQEKYAQVEEIMREHSIPEESAIFVFHTQKNIE